MSEEDNKTFEQLGLRPDIVATVAALGYEVPTPIQERTIPRMLAGGDLIGQAQTGTGKTAAFALPILEKLDPALRKTQALVLTPTRELAMQVAEAIHTYAQRLGGISVIPIYGGAPIVPQLKRLERGVHVVVGTPGRLIDHLDRRSLDLSNVRVLVLDEADEMLKMGFAEDVDRILAAAPAEKQTALFSATMPDEVLRIAKRHLRNPERIEIEHRAMTTPAIEQRFLNVSEGQKLEALTQILELEPAEAVLIFRRTKTGSAELAEKLEARGFAAVAMHGDMSQPLRENVIRRLRAGQVEIVVATDVAARGLDVEQIEHVINYDVPYDVEAYVHRIGRTGRAGRSGVATLFITPRERRMMREIERFTNSPIKPMKMPTRADLAAKRIEVFKEHVRKTIQEGELDLYVELVEQLVEEGPFDMADVAAAASRIANGSRALTRGKADEQVQTPPQAERYASDERVRSRQPRQDTGRSFEPKEGDDRTIRLEMSVGKADGIRPADVVGSIANEADIPGSDIGPIEIREDVTYVGIPQRYVDLVIAKVGKKRFRGRAVNLRVAGPEDSSPRPRRAPARRDESRGSFVPRSGGAPARTRSTSRPVRRDEAPRPRAESGRGYQRDEATRPAARRSPRTDSPRPHSRDTASRDAGKPSRAAAKPFYSDVKRSAGFKGKKRPR
jgi:ATP-dependent RNA helicase DeaD